MRRLVILLVAGALCAGCSNGSTTAGATASPPPGAGIAAGVGQAIGGETLPDGWPQDVPVADGAKLSHASSVGGTMVALYTVTGSSLEAVRDFFTAKLPAAGFTITSSEGKGPGQLIAFTGKGFAGNIVIADVLGKLNYTVNVKKQ